MDIGERRAHGDGVQTVQGLGKQAALKAGVNGLDAQLGAKELTIALDKDVADRRMLGIAPAGILELKLGVEARTSASVCRRSLNSFCSEVIEERGDSMILTWSSEVATTPMLEETSTEPSVATLRRITPLGARRRARMRASADFWSMASTSASSAISTVQVKPGSKTSSSAVTSAMMPFAISPRPRRQRGRRKPARPCTHG